MTSLEQLICPILVSLYEHPQSGLLLFLLLTVFMWLRVFSYSRKFFISPVMIQNTQIWFVALSFIFYIVIMIVKVVYSPSRSELIDHTLGYYRHRAFTPGDFINLPHNYSLFFNALITSGKHTPPDLCGSWVEQLFILLLLTALCYFFLCSILLLLNKKTQSEMLIKTNGKIINLINCLIMAPVFALMIVASFSALKINNFLNILLIPLMYGIIFYVSYSKKIFSSAAIWYLQIWFVTLSFIFFIAYALPHESQIAYKLTYFLYSSELSNVILSCSFLCILFVLISEKSHSKIWAEITRKIIYFISWAIAPFFVCIVFLMLRKIFYLNPEMRVFFPVMQALLFILCNIFVWWIIFRFSYSQKLFPNPTLKYYAERCFIVLSVAFFIFVWLIKAGFELLLSLSYIFTGKAF